MDTQISFMVDVAEKFNKLNCLVVIYRVDLRNSWLRMV